MGRGDPWLSFAVGAALLLAVNNGQAEQPRSIPLEVTTSDVLKFLGAHVWKWTYHPVDPYKEFTLRLVHYTRTGPDDFKHDLLYERTFTHDRPCISDDILIVASQKDDRVAFMEAITNVLTEQSTPTELKSLGYVFYGDGDGGTPGLFGSELLLMARFIQGRESENKKENISDYVAVEIETK